MKRHQILLVAVAVLILAVLACSSEGGGSYSFSTMRTSSGGAGHIEVMGDADGSVTSDTEIDEDYPNASADLEVAAGVKEGSYTVEFLNDDGSVAFTLDVKPGELAKGGGTVTTNDEGEVEYRISAQGAKGIKIIIDYELQ